MFTLEKQEIKGWPNLKYQTWSKWKKAKLVAVLRTPNTWEEVRSYVGAEMTISCSPFIGMALPIIFILFNSWIRQDLAVNV